MSFDYGDLSNIGFPTTESEQEYFSKMQRFKPRSKKGTASIGFETDLGGMEWASQRDNVGDSVWNYNDPFGFSGKPPKKKMYRKVNGKRRLVTQPRQDNPVGDLISFAQEVQTKRRIDKPKSMSIQGKRYLQDPKDPNNYISEATFKKRYGGKTMVNRPKNYAPRYETGNVLINTIQNFNESLGRRAERKRYEQSQPFADEERPKGKYIVQGTDDQGRTFTEYYSAPNTAYSAQQKYRSKGWSVDAIRIDR